MKIVTRRQVALANLALDLLDIQPHLRAKWMGAYSLIESSKEKLLRGAATDPAKLRWWANSILLAWREQEDLAGRDYTIRRRMVI
jgi:hypothetical protein